MKKYIASLDGKNYEPDTIGDCPQEAVYSMSEMVDGDSRVYVKKCEIKPINDGLSVYQLIGRARVFRIYPKGW